ncbi:ExbD/TolR family protein [Planctomicrobium piriforme]|uniref:Biopolymer transport protein ExbD n=1 Tax=Planctomicrobium piriforme TaxID=1576369 RepID=A0A1I3CCU1_9PLAN|nr:biopolymer transporter ExbD [Planctomicrobium piriforme]SFH72009.1 Biopolymer transport protein ExbD [Planctomicrobium piriforme]
MFGKKSGRQLPEDDDEINITAMIDIVMLLLIFFMITSKLESTTSLQVPPAKHGQAVSVDQSIVFSIFKTDGEPEIYLSDGKQENGPVDLDAVRAYTKTGVDEDKKFVIIKADREVPSGFVEEVARAVSDVDPDLKFYLGVVDRPQ